MGFSSCVYLAFERNAQCCILTSGAEGIFRAAAIEEFGCVTCHRRQPSEQNIQNSATSVLPVALVLLLAATGGRSALGHWVSQMDQKQKASNAQRIKVKDRCIRLRSRVIHMHHSLRL